MEMDAIDRSAHWWRQRRSEHRAVERTLWVDDLWQYRTSPLAVLPPVLNDDSVEPLGHTEERLAAALKRLAELSARLRRFTLLAGAEQAFLGHPTDAIFRAWTETTAGERMVTLSKMIVEYRVAITVAIEAVDACAKEQKAVSCAGLLTKKLGGEAARPQRSSPSPQRAKGALAARGGLGSLRRQNTIDRNTMLVLHLEEAGSCNLDSFSHERHDEILRSLPKFLGFLPLPLERDPLLLSWFDQQAWLWSSASSMPPEYASVAVHSAADLMRMEKAESRILQVLKREEHESDIALEPPSVGSTLGDSPVFRMRRYTVHRRHASLMDKGDEDAPTRTLDSPPLQRPPALTLREADLPQQHQRNESLSATLNERRKSLMHRDEEALSVTSLRSRGGSAPAHDDLAAGQTVPAQALYKVLESLLYGVPGGYAKAMKSRSQLMADPFRASQLLSRAGMGTRRLNLQVISMAELVALVAKVRRRLAAQKLAKAVRAYATKRQKQALQASMRSKLATQPSGRLKVSKSEMGEPDSFKQRSEWRNKVLIFSAGVIATKVSRWWHSSAAIENRQQRAVSVTRLQRAVRLIRAQKMLKSLRDDIFLQKSRFRSEWNDPPFHEAARSLQKAWALYKNSRRANLQRFEMATIAPSVNALALGEEESSGYQGALSRAATLQAKISVLRQKIIRSYTDIEVGASTDNLAAEMALPTLELAEAQLRAKLIAAFDAYSMHRHDDELRAFEASLQNAGATDCVKQLLASSAHSPTFLVEEELSHLTPSAKSDIEVDMDDFFPDVGALALSRFEEAEEEATSASLGGTAKEDGESQSAGATAQAALRSIYLAVVAWHKAVGASIILRHVHLNRVSTQLEMLKLQRQQTLRTALGASAAVTLAEAIERGRVIDECLTVAGEFEQYVPCRDEDAWFRLALRCERGRSDQTPVFDEEAGHLLLEDLRDWYSVPSELRLEIDSVEAVQPLVFEVKVSMRTISGERPSKALAEQVRILYDVMGRVGGGGGGPPVIERERLRATAEHLHVPYISPQLLASQLPRVQLDWGHTLFEHAKMMRERREVLTARLAAIKKSRQYNFRSLTSHWRELKGSMTWAQTQILVEADERRKQQGEAAEEGAEGPSLSFLTDLVSGISSSRERARLRWNHARALVMLTLQKQRSESVQVEQEACAKELRRADAEIEVCERLLETTMHELRDSGRAVVPGSQVPIDIEYNFGVESSERSRHASSRKILPAADPTREATGRVVDARICYYCAWGRLRGFELRGSGSGGEDGLAEPSTAKPVRALHPFAHCPRRKAAGLREFSLEALNIQRTAWAQEASAQKRVIEMYETQLASANLSQQSVRKIEGACRFLRKMLTNVTKEGSAASHTRVQPPPRDFHPSQAGGYHSQRMRLKRTIVSQWRATLAVQVARALREEDGHIGEIKALSRLTPRDNYSLDAVSVVRAAEHLGLRLCEEKPGDVLLQGDFRALWLAVHFASAPMPHGWSTEEEDGETLFIDEDGDAHESHPLLDVYQGLVQRHIAHDLQARRPLYAAPELRYILFEEDGRAELYDMVHIASEDQDVECSTGDLDTIPALLRPRHLKTPATVIEEPVAVRLVEEAKQSILARAHALSKSELVEGLEEVLRGLRDTFTTQRIQSLLREPRTLEAITMAADDLGLPWGDQSSNNRDRTGNLWIADAMLGAKLPLGWSERVFDTERGELTFYHCEYTGQSTWYHPQKLYLRGVTEAIKEVYAERVERGYVDHEVNDLETTATTKAPSLSSFRQESFMRWRRKSVCTSDFSLADAVRSSRSVLQTLSQSGAAGVGAPSND